jgi:hypothetical protein
MNISLCVFTSTDLKIERKRHDPSHGSTGFLWKMKTQYSIVFVFFSKRKPDLFVCLMEVDVRRNGKNCKRIIQEKLELEMEMGKKNN